MSLQMRVGLGQFNELTDEKLAFIKQMGCDDFLMNTPRLPATSNGNTTTWPPSKSGPTTPNCG